MWEAALRRGGGDGMVRGLAPMKLILAAFLFAAFTVRAADAGAGAVPTVDQILDRYVEASGGKARLAELTTRLMKGTLETAVGISGRFEVRMKSPNKAVSSMELQTFGTLREGYDGTVGWSSAPFQGTRLKEGTDLARVQRNAVFPRELRIREIYTRFEVKGSQKVGTADAWVVEATPKTGNPDTFYFDKKSGLLLREETTVDTVLGTFKFQTELSDYREVDGVQVPFSMRLPNPPELGLKVTFEEVKHNVPIADAEFAKPAK